MPRTALITEHTSLLTGKAAVDRIAMEASVLHNLTEVAREYLPALISDLHTMVANINEDEISTETKEILSSSMRVNYKIQHLDFLTFGENYTSVPEGFSGKFLPYGYELNKIIATVSSRITELLGQTNTYMAMFISNKDHQISMKDLSKYYSSVDQEIKDISSALSVYFTKDSHITKARIRDILNRLGDIPELKEVASEIDKRHNKIKLRDLRQSVQQTIDMADIIIQNVKNDQGVIIAPAVAKSLSQGLYFTAQYIELVSAVYFDTMVYLASINKLYNKILKS